MKHAFLLVDAWISHCFGNKSLSVPSTAELSNTWSAFTQYCSERLVHTTCISKTCHVDPQTQAVKRSIYGLTVGFFRLKAHPSLYFPLTIKAFKGAWSGSESHWPTYTAVGANTAKMYCLEHCVYIGIFSGDIPGVNIKLQKVSEWPFSERSLIHTILEF